MNFGVVTMVPARALIHPMWDFCNVLCRLNSVIPNIEKLSTYVSITFL
jgi:hypothetical protein